MKVLFVPPLNFSLHLGGFESQVRHIYTELQKLSIDVSWYDLINTDLKLYDIIHIHSSSPELYNIVKRAKDYNKKIVVTPMIGSPKLSNLFYSVALKFSQIPLISTNIKLASKIISNADSIITLTPFEKHRIHKVFHIKNEKITIIPNGIDDEYFKKNDVTIKLPFNKYLITVGRIEQDKNQIELIRAVNKLNLNLIIVGEAGNGQQDYEAKCKNEANSNIYFWGKEKNLSILRHLYKNADITIIPSLTEMLPLVIFESLSQKTRVICTTKCGLYPRFYDGLYYSSPNKSSLEKTIKNLINDSDNIKIDTNHFHSWKDIAIQHLNIYNSLFL